LSSGSIITGLRPILSTLAAFWLFESTILAQEEEAFYSSESGSIMPVAPTSGIPERRFEPGVISRLIQNFVKPSKPLRLNVFLPDTHIVYNNMGDRLISGVELFTFFTAKSNDREESIGGLYRRQLSGGIAERSVYKNANVGLSFDSGNVFSDVVAGNRLSLAFAPYVLNRVQNVLGVKWDFKLHDGDDKDDIYFSSFFTPVFRPDGSENDESSDSEGIEPEDQLFLAGRLVLRPAGLLKRISGLEEKNFSVAEDLHLAVSYVHTGLRNGLKNSGGSESAFANTYGIGSLVNKYEAILGLEVNGKHGGTTYDFAAAFNSKDTYVVDDRNLDQQNEFVRQNTSNKQAYIFWIGGTGVPFTKLLKKSLIFDFRLWDIDPGYGAAFAIDDDDDNDGWRDDNKDNDGYFPYQEADTDWDEPNTGVLSSVLNRNANAVPDYLEDFLVFNVDRRFSPEIQYEDLNFNGVYDREENDKDPDFPYDIDRQGFFGAIGFRPAKTGFRAILTLIRNSVKSGSNIGADVKILNARYKRKFGKKHEILFDTALSFVGDLIADDTINAGPDTLEYRDNQIYSWRTDYRYRINRRSHLSIRYRGSVNRRLFDASTIRENNLILKGNYRYYKKGFTLEPKIKIEKYAREVSTFNMSAAHAALRASELNLIGIVKWKYKLVSGLKFQNGYQFWYFDNELNPALSFRKHSLVFELQFDGENIGSIFKKKDSAILIGLKQAWVTQPGVIGSNKEIELYARAWAAL